MTFYKISDHNQDQNVDLILSSYRSNSLLVRSILTGQFEENKDKFEDALWYDLEMLKRQKELDGKPYRDPKLYEDLSNLLEKFNTDLLSFEKELSDIQIHKKISEVCFDYLEKDDIPSDDKTIIEKIKEKLSPRESEIFGERDYSAMAEYIKIEFNEIKSNKSFSEAKPEKKKNLFFLKFLHRQFSPENTTRMSIINDQINERISIYKKGKKKLFMESSELSYEEVLRRLEDIKLNEKTKKIDFSTKESAQHTLQEYILYRTIKNKIHQFTHNFFQNHDRHNSQNTIAKETGYQYFTGFKIVRDQRSLKKSIYPFVEDSEGKFKSEKKIISEDKALTLPSSWSYIFYDIGIGLFKGRYGNIAFALLTPDQKVATIENNYSDLQFSDLSLFPTEAGHRKLFTSEEIHSQKEHQRELAMQDPSHDPWFDNESKLSGHTESLIYGAPTAIVVINGYEDVALEARKKYSESGLISQDAPFFYYDPTQEISKSLVHVSDEEVIKNAKKIFSDPTIIRLKYRYDNPQQSSSPSPELSPRSIKSLESLSIDKGLVK